MGGSGKKFGRIPGKYPDSSKIMSKRSKNGQKMAKKIGRKPGK